jgi:LacI family transcriptional regulator
MSDTKKKLTQKDVAELAGVSQAIVSHVVNETDKAIPEATRQRVLKAMEELSYIPNKAARSLRGQKTYAIACIVPDITNAFFPAFLRGIQSVADSHDYDLIIYDSNTSDTKELHYARTLGCGHVDGAIAVLFHRDQRIVADLLDKGIQLVTLEQGCPEPDRWPHDLVYVDDISAARKAVSYLIKLGHSRIGILSGTAGTPPHRNRLMGYCQALADHDISFNDLYVRNGDYTENGGYLEMQALLALPVRPSALFAANDLMAIGAMLAVQKEGLRVPQDIAIIGFDDIPAAKLVNPRLTTVAQFQDQIGQQAAAMLFDRLCGQVAGQPRCVEMPFEIVIREST